jgi:hypothetical protein
VANARLPLATTPTPGTDEAATPWRHAVALWFLIIACESVNGSLRELALTPWLGAERAGQVGFATAVVVILTLAGVFAPWLEAKTRRARWQVGLLWAVLTFVFEAVLARTMGLSLDAFVQDYDPARGGLMAYGLLVLLLAPTLGAWLSGARRLAP